MRHPFPQTESHPPLIVAGLGSPFGADAVAWQVLEHLPAYFDGTGPKFLTLRTPADLLEVPLANAKLILLDAVASPSPRGELLPLAPTDLVQEPWLSSHALSLPQLLSLIEATSDEALDYCILGISVGERPGPSFSREEVQTLAQSVADRIKATQD